ncbi:MAG: ASKHA domain-containing protein [Spirochaetaceae bacterium]|jgi:uncharacterized 2Fe-2S/4Fe-4S cluster protein (DUF4445 family)|nr:ASKHA domain-containing protein [Spirochaetaceae bacterium]
MAETVEAVFISGKDGARTSVTAAKGSTILEAARSGAARNRAIALESPCNGSGICHKCEVSVAGRRVLACQYRLEAGTEIVIQDRGADNETLKILAGGSSVEVELKPFITKEFSGGLTGVYGGRPAGGESPEGRLGLEAGDTSGESYGLAVDIGTTTLVLALTDLNTGRVLASESALNPQALYAQDVLGRIRFAVREEGGLGTLHHAFLDALLKLLDALILKSGVPRERVYEMIYSGNTTMLHLACGIDPSSLGRYPYEPALSGGQHLPAEDLRISPFGLIWLPPLVSAWVGADIVSGILAAGLDQRRGVTLFIDIGTNGEMVLARDGALAASSTAAGPAFEGMNISCGMRASRGAVESFSISGGECGFTVIGGGEDSPEAAGICGSGLLDIAGELVKNGVIGKNGRFARPEELALREGELARRLRPLPDAGGKNAFFITDTVYLSQKDIRQIQLAKGAIRCGIEMLLARFGLGAAEVDTVEIAGAFGYHLRESSLLSIGLLPPEFAGKVHFAGNTSLSGAGAFLLNQDFRGRMRDLAGRVEKVELAEDPDFEKNFVRAMGF